MPVNLKKMNAMEKTYGKKKAKKVYYAMENQAMSKTKGEMMKKMPMKPMMKEKKMKLMMKK